MTVGDADHTEPYDFLVYQLGSLDFRVKNGATGLVAFETSNPTNRDAITAFEYCRDQCIDTGKNILLKNGHFYDVYRSLILDYSLGAGHPRNQHWGTLYPWSNAQIRARGNFPAIQLKNTSCSLRNIYFTHAEDVYTSDIVEILDQGVEVAIEGCRWYDFAKYKGHCIGLHLADGTKAQYKVHIRNNQMYGFESNIHVTQAAGVGGMGWQNSIHIQHNDFWVSKYVLKVEGGGSGTNVMSEWKWHDNDWQPVAPNVPASGEAPFMYEGFGNTIGVGGQHHSQCTMWDLPTGVSYANIKASDHLDTFGCRNDYKIGGAGNVNTNAELNRNSSYTVKEAVATYSGNGATRVWLINHNLNVVPKNVQVQALSVDALSGGAIGVTNLTTTQATITFSRPPRIGTNNVVVGWRARL